jgi:hypothetical protein
VTGCGVSEGLEGVRRQTRHSVTLRDAPSVLFLAHGLHTESRGMTRYEDLVDRRAEPASGSFSLKSSGALVAALLCAFGAFLNVTLVWAGGR